MTQNQSTKHNANFAIAFTEALIVFLPAMLRIYSELRKRAKQGGRVVKIVPDEIGAVLGYDPEFIQGVLEDMSQLKVIKYEAGNQHEKQSVIILIL